MHNGVLLDPTTGRPEGESKDLLLPDGRSIREHRNAGAGWFESDNTMVWSPEGVPDSVLEYLGKSREQSELHDRGVREGFYAKPHQNSLQTWVETLYATIADGTAVTSSSETIMVPDFTLPANYLVPGRCIRYTVFGRQSTAITTPGTITLRLRYGGVGGTLVCASGAFAPDPTAAATNLTFWVQYYMVCRSAGSSGTVMGVGQANWSDYDDASVAALVANLNMQVIPTSAPATATVNTTTASALSVTYQSSVATASMTAHVAILESLS